MNSAQRWTVIVPVKPTVMGKSRLRANDDFAAAVALDTIEAAANADSADVVIVVTADTAFADVAAALPGVRTVIEDAPHGIAAAIATGAAQAPNANLAVLLGDLPALRSRELDAALAVAAGHPRCYVPDAEGTGSTLVTALAGVGLLSAFGEDSAARHAALGLERLVLARDSGLRRDVDEPAQLAEAIALGLGPRTTALRSAR